MALGVPCLVILTLIVASGAEPDWIGVPLILLILAFFHFYAYAVLGLPLFLEFYRSPEALLWRPAFAIVLGEILGVAVIFGYFIASEQSEGLLGSPLAWGVGSTYGLATAFAAWLQRPRRAQPPPFPYHRLVHAS